SARDSVLCLVTPHPPSSPLFPYTTLFRSKQKVTYEEDPATGETVEVRTPYAETKVINRANIQAVLGSSFRITGLDSNAEAAELRSEEHTSELQSRFDLVCRLLLEKKKQHN